MNNSDYHDQVHIEALDFFESEKLNKMPNWIFRSDVNKFWQIGKSYTTIAGEIIDRIINEEGLVSKLTIKSGNREIHCSNRNYVFNTEESLDLPSNDFAYEGARLVLLIKEFDKERIINPVAVLNPERGHAYFYTISND